jgi:hypothetical protein
MEAMKKSLSVFICLAIGIGSFLMSIRSGHCQDNLTGAWEGIFMNDFRTVINFDSDREKEYFGNIKMFAQGNLIQDDKLEDIKLANNDLSFIIPAKETSFKGSFDKLKSELSGEFVFPDGSIHPIQLKRKLTEEHTVEQFEAAKEKKFDPQDLRSDLSFLYSSLKEHHPALYAFTPKDSFDLLAEQLLSEINKPLTLEGFYLLTAKLTDAVHCSHTGGKLPSSYQNLANDFGKYFPLRLFFDRGKAYYLSAGTDFEHPIAPGNEVMSINDRSIKEIIEHLFYYIPSEGCNTTTKYNELNKSFNTLFYLLDDSEQFMVKFKKGETIESTTVSASPLSDVNANSGIYQTDKPVEFNYISKGSVGMLDVSSFAIPDMDRYLHQLDSIFADMKTKETDNLIVDLRDNSGGHPIFAAQLFSYLTDRDFIYFKTNPEVEEFRPLYNTMQPNKLNFTRNIYVLINGGCLSTTGHLISLLQFHTGAQFIGEEPGSTFRCNDFSKEIALPKSGILVNVPRTTFETSVSGFALCDPFPLDFQVNETATDLIGKEDPFVGRVMSVIKE